MTRLRRYRPTPSMVVACIALLVALGGASYAATALPPNSVGTAQVKNFSLLRQHFKPGLLRPGSAGTGIGMNRCPSRGPDAQLGDRHALESSPGRSGGKPLSPLWAAPLMRTPTPR